MGVLFLSEADVIQLMPMSNAVNVVRTAFTKLALDEAENVPRRRCRTDRAVLHLLPAAARTLPALGFKAYTTTASVARFHVFLYDPIAGHLVAILEADALGQIRTGAASAVATDVLARADAKTLAVLGTGKQARTQVLGVTAVRKLRNIKVFGRNADHLQQFAARLSSEAGVPVEPVASVQEAVQGADIVCTATTSRDPILFGDWLMSGAHLNLVGSNYLAKAEADVSVFRRAELVVVDSKDQARLEAGDFVAALHDNILEWSRVHELSDVLVHRAPGRAQNGEITVFKSLGLGLEDVAVGAAVLAEARARGVGRELDWNTAAEGAQ